MLVSEYKLSFGILTCVIFISILAVNFLSGFATIELHWKSGSLLSQNNSRNTLVQRMNSQKEPKVYRSNGNRHWCDKMYNNYTWFQTDHGRLLLNETIYYCGIPKCGSTFMGTFLHKLFSSKIGNNSSSFMLRIKKNVTISNVYSFMFVRDPYSRLFSAYENKLFNPNSFFSKLGTDVIKEVRQNASALSLQFGHDVTFTELIQYIIKFYEQGRNLNPHIAAMHTICHPCRQKYNFIGKLETMTTDLVQLVKEWNTWGIISKKMNTTDVESEVKDGRIYGTIGHMFRFHHKAKDLISRYKLFHRTWSSYQIRGIILKDYEMPFNESRARTAHSGTYTKAIQTAVSVSKMHKSELKAQRKEALYQAYRNVPVDLLEKLGQFLKTDCELFGYENRPGWIFNQSEWKPLSGHNYFEWL